MRAVVTVGENGYVTNAEFLSDQDGPKKVVQLADNQYSFHGSKVPSKFYKKWKEYKVNNGTLIWSPAKV